MNLPGILANLYILIKQPSNPTDFIITPLSYMRKERHREVKYLAQGHTASMQQRWYLKGRNLAPESLSNHYIVLRKVEAHIICCSPPKNPQR